MAEQNLRMDRTITFGLVLALLWAGAAEARLSQLETQAAADFPVAERLARLEEQMIGARQSLTRIERRLDEED